MTIYLDNNATTKIDKRVLEAMLPFLNEGYGNPSSIHRIGRFARTAMEKARVQVAQWVGVSPKQVIFTSGGTEANNIALQGVASRTEKNAHMLVSAIEHPCVLETGRYLQRKGWEITQIPVSKNCEIDPAEVAARLQENTVLVSSMLVNNETGVIQNAPGIAEILQDKGIYFHVDAVQGMSKTDHDFNSIQADLMSLSSHKIFGPKGAGALIVKPGVDYDPLFFGGGQEMGFRSGTENVAAVVGFGKAAELAAQDYATRKDIVTTLRDAFESKIKEIEAINVIAQDAERVGHVSLISMSGYDGETLLMMLDKEDIAVSSGSACSAGHGKTSHVLAAMDLPPEQTMGVIRISFSHENTMAEVEKLVSVLNELQSSRQSKW